MAIGSSTGSFGIANGETTLVLESRDLKGGDPVVLLSNPLLTDFTWGQSGRLIYSVRELPPNQYDSNLWEMRYDQDTGKPKGNPRRLTDWTGFYFGNPQLTADGKRFVFLNGRAQSDVYVGELANGGAELKTPQRVTLDDRVDWPGGWSADSKTMFLYSDRNGDFDIYKQGVSERNADPGHHRNRRKVGAADQSGWQVGALHAVAQAGQWQTGQPQES